MLTKKDFFDGIKNFFSWIFQKILGFFPKNRNPYKRTGKKNGFLDFLWKVTPISLILTILMALIVEKSFCALIDLHSIIYTKMNALPFINEKIKLTTEYSIKAVIVACWVIPSLHVVKEAHLIVFKVWKERLPFPSLYLGEGLKGSIIPRPIINGEQTTIVEFTLGTHAETGKHKSISCQTLDDQEVILEYADQGRTFDPFLWKNVEDPMGAIENKLLSQLRIIVSLFKEKEINTIKGTIAGMLLGKEYIVWRNSNGDLLRNGGGTVLSVLANEEEMQKILDKPTDKVTKRCLTEYLKDQSVEIIVGSESYYPEMIPSNNFDLDAVWKEARRVGAEIEPPSLRDITPPEKVREAAEQKRIEELQGDARLEENMRHSQIALAVLGLPKDTNVSELNEEMFAKWRALKDDSMIQEKKITKIKIDSSNNQSDLGDKIITAATLNRGGGK